MSTGSLFLSISDLQLRPLSAAVEISLQRDTGQFGQGGQNVNFQFLAEGTTEAELSGIATRGGTGSRYILRVSAKRYKEFAFTQFISEGDQRALQPVYMVRDPKSVKAIIAPNFAEQPLPLRQFLQQAQMAKPAKEDQDLVGLQGEALFQQLGDKRKAALLNIFCKSTHKATTGEVWNFFRQPLVIRQDRCFVAVQPELVNYISQDDAFIPAPNTLHKPLEGYQLFHSVKSNDAHANLQITLMRNANGDLAADVDIDESAGFGHWGEVLRNFFTKGRTNPYVVHQLLLAADTREQTLDPGYELA